MGYNTTSKAFDLNANATVCKRLKTTAISCNMPKVNATKTTYTSTSGCGNCTTTDTHCEHCTKEKCNKSSAVRVAELIAPLLAVFFNLIDLLNEKTLENGRYYDFAWMCSHSKSPYSKTKEFFSYHDSRIAVLKMNNSCLSNNLTFNTFIMGTVS